MFPKFFWKFYAHSIHHSCASTWSVGVSALRGYLDLPEHLAAVLSRALKNGLALANVALVLSTEAAEMAKNGGKKGGKQRRQAAGVARGFLLGTREAGQQEGMRGAQRRYRQRRFSFTERIISPCLRRCFLSLTTRPLWSPIKHAVKGRE